MSMRMIISRIVSCWGRVHRLTVHRRHARILQLSVLSILRIVVDDWTFSVIFLFFIIFLHRIHSVVLVSLTLVILLVFNGELFPCISHETSD